MRLLALDTSSDACSVALQLDHSISAEHVIKPKEHTNILIPMIRGLLNDAGVALRDLDAIVLGNGPGSFIGVRIAASVAQGLAYGSGLKIVPVSSMAAVAAEVMQTRSASDVVVAQDARMNEVYLGTYRGGGDGLPVATGNEVIQPVEQIAGLTDIGSSGLYAAGIGWNKHPSLLEMNRKAIAELVDVYYPKARFLLTLGARAIQAGDLVDPEDLVPTYIRMTVAEKPREAAR